MTAQAVNINPNRQFLLTVDEIGFAYLSKLVPMLRYVEVEGMSMVDQPNHHVLVTPTPKPKEEVQEASDAVV